MCVCVLKIKKHHVLLINFLRRHHEYYLAFSAVTLLVMHQEGHVACKN